MDGSMSLPLELHREINVKLTQNANVVLNAVNWTSSNVVCQGADRWNILTICCCDNRASGCGSCHLWWVNDGFSASSCVYRLEELVRLEEALSRISFRPLRRKKSSRRKSWSLIRARRPPHLSGAATWTGCCNWLRGAQGRVIGCLQQCSLACKIWFTKGALIKSNDSWVTRSDGWCECAEQSFWWLWVITEKIRFYSEVKAPMQTEHSVI